MICTRCGAVNEGGYRFCSECGAPLPSAQGDATVVSGAPGAGLPPVPGPAGAPVSGASVPAGAGTPRPPVPMPGAPVPPASGGAAYTNQSATTAALPPVAPGGTIPGDGGDGARTVAKKRRPALVLAIVLAVLVVVGGLVAFFTYRNEVWGGKTLPDPASLASEVTDAKGNRKASVVKAKDVTEALKAKGLKTKTVPVFSGSDKGVFLGYSGVKQGDRVDAGSTVVVQESAGPGVPKDTVGKDVNKVVDTFAGMGVPIHYKQVVISSDSKTPEGQVSTTYPAPGVGLADDEMENGIFIGVASKGDGIPVDVMGMDKDKAVSELESQGYDVDLEPHYSSKQYVGKISGSYPAPGSALDSGDSVTLYYGVDKSSNMDLLTKTSGSGGYEMQVTKHNATPMIGMYCRSEVKDTSKDCITLEEAEGPYGDSAGGGFMQIKGREPADSFDTLGLNNYSQDVSSVMVSPDGAPGMSASDLPMVNHLLLGKTGAFELYAGMGMPNCGDKVMTGAMFEYCRSGSYGRASDPENFPSGKNSGETFNMKDFLVYVPVGADVKALEDSGYFDSKALDTAKKQKAVDTSRPFIIMRDSSLYSETKVSADNVSYYKNPFVPNNDNGTNHLVGMKPAPSNDTVYYLVEQDGDLDWDSLPDADVKQPSAEDSGDADSSGSSTKMSKTLTEAMKVAEGDYILSSGAGAWSSDLTINADGTFKGVYQDANAGDTGDGYPKGSMAESKYTGRFKSATKNSDGTYTLQCDTGAFKIDGEVGSSHIEDGTKIDVTKPVGMESCGTFTLYPKGYETSKLDQQQLTWGGGAYGKVASSSELPGPALYNTESDSDRMYTFYSGTGY